MSGSNKKTGFAIVTLLFGVIVFVLFCIQIFKSGGSTAVSRYKATQITQKNAKDAEQEIKDRCLQLAPNAMSKCITQIIEATNEHDRSEADRIAQEDMALWAFWMVVVSGGTVIITGVGVWFVKRTLDSSLEAVDIADATNKLTRAAFNADLRPYLSVNVISAGPIVFTEEDISIEIRMETKNVGRTPAFGVSLVPILKCFTPPTLLTHKSEAENYWSSLNNLRLNEQGVDGNQGGIALFPSELTSYTQKIRVSKNAIVGTASPENLHLMVFISCTYRRLEPGIHQTGLIFHVSSGAETNNTVQSFQMIESGQIPQSDFRLMKAVSAGFVT